MAKKRTPTILDKIKELARKINKQTPGNDAQKTK